MTELCTQPCCGGCWTMRWPLHQPPTMAAHPPRETCCYCGLPTRSGIYIRVDPATVRYLTLEEA